MPIPTHELHAGKLLSHLVLRRRQRRHARMALLRGYAALARGRCRFCAASPAGSITSSSLDTTWRRQRGRGVARIAERSGVRATRCLRRCDATDQPSAFFPITAPSTSEGARGRRHRPRFAGRPRRAAWFWRPPVAW